MIRKTITIQDQTAKNVTNIYKSGDYYSESSLYNELIELGLMIKNSDKSDEINYEPLKIDAAKQAAYHTLLLEKIFLSTGGNKADLLELFNQAINHNDNVLDNNYRFDEHGQKSI